MARERVDTTIGQSPKIDWNSQLQKYYAAFESRIGYRLFLGGTRHFGYFKQNTRWPFPINDALRRMENYMFNSLKLGPEAKLLDAGCGVGDVTLHMARKRLYVEAIDIVSNHVQ